MNSRISACLTLIAAVAVSACSATPTHFYTLLPPAPIASSASTQDPAFQIDVLPIEIPAQVDVQQLVVREGNGVLTPVETRRWIAPLSLELRTSLTASLTQKLGVPAIGGVAPDERIPLYRVQVAVQRFESALGNSARIDAVWTVRASRDSKRSATCESKASVPVGPGYEALTEGHQRALGMIADQIAKGVLAVNANQAASACIEAGTR